MNCLCEKERGKIPGCVHTVAALSNWVSEVLLLARHLMGLVGATMNFDPAVDFDVAKSKIWTSVPYRCPEVESFSLNRRSETGNFVLKCNVSLVKNLTNLRETPHKG